ncbi:hypothetical protein CYCD_11360 [Tenuifilaceae bacterium CYCD]|nr:hypothetical protein CYCD_11360 [Tenuifilaceae bacterium CYCD]
MRRFSYYRLFVFLFALLNPFWGLSYANNAITGKATSSLTKVLYFDETSLTNNDEDSTSTEALDLDQLADSLTQKVLGENRIVDMLDPEKVYTLPLGIVKEIGGVYYTIVLDNLKFTSSGAVMKAYMSLSFPGSTKKFGLVADNVKIGMNGIEAAQLKMLKDKSLDLMGQELLINADSTFVEWDCNGYKGAQLSAKLFLDESKFYKENPATRNVITGAKVAGKIFCAVTDFNDILLSVTLDPFQLKDLKDFSFYPKEIVLDLSDKRNCESMQFPNGYQSALFDGEDKNLWRGLYISSFALKFPKTFAKSGPVPEIVASKFLIDMEGISGSLAYNAQIIGFDKGNLGGWKFSINSISLSLMKNELSGYGMAGGIIVPITESDKPMTYNATIDADKNFLFTVSLPGDIKAPLFGSGTTLTLSSNSKITVESKDGVFYPKAELHGKMNVNVGASPGVKLAQITFQGLVIQTRAPQIDIQSFSMTSGAMAGFPVQINEIALERNTKDTLLGLKFDASVNLMEGKIAGNSAFVVWAKNDKGDWKYKDIELRKIVVEAKTGAIDLKGQLINYKDDPTYGNGYLGSVDMTVTPGINVYATAQFGNVSGYRYWYADAGVSIPNGITIFTGFAIYGFGGGAYYHMERVLPSNVQMIRDTSSTAQTAPKIGISKSGITYKPSQDVSLGVMAKVIVGTQPKPDAFNGSITFGIEFTPSYGIKLISFDGDGRFMTEINKDQTDSKVRATVHIQYAVTKKELSGYSEAYINVGDIIKGGGANNLAGRVDFYFASSEWYIYIGTPTSPINLKIMKALNAKSYFMVGSKLPDFPSLPSNVASLSNKINFSNMRSDLLTKNGGGFAFGASITAGTGEKSFLIFYGNFDLGAGFDFMLKNFGSDARCEGYSGQLGINGWYAQGQAWSWVDAKIGVKVKVLRRTRKFTIMDAGFAAVLGAQLPNPTYLSGAVQAKFSVLGGLVKGKCNFEFSYGEQCKLIGTSELAGVTAIAELTPTEGSKEVDVFTTPQVAFNMPIEETFEILGDDGNTKKFRATLDYFKVMQGDQEISCSKEWNTTKDVLALRPLEILPGQTGLKVKVKVHFQEKTGNGSWIDYTVDGKVESEEKLVAFATGEAPDYITENNVNYTYPVKNMVNFYKNEYGKCYIQVYQGISYLFNKPGSWRYEAHFKSGTNTSKMSITYDNAAKRVVLNVPDNLVNEAIYSMKIVRVENTNNQFQADKNVKLTETNVNEDQSVTTKDIEGTLTDEGLTELYTLHFRTSKFNTFVEKMIGFQKREYQCYISQGVYSLSHKYTNGELFDKWELENIQIEAQLSNNQWFNTYYKDLLYSGYPVLSNVTINWRSTNISGVPPVLVCNIIQNTTPPVLNEQNISTGTFNFDNSITPWIEFNLNYYISMDYNDLKNKSLSNMNQSYCARIVNSTFRALATNSVHYVKYKYFIPGLSTSTSEHQTYYKYY